MKGIFFMKIEKIIFKNFAAIKNAMDCNEFSIDFSNTMNKVCLLIGPNGSGKTTILSLLHPFAGVGNLDVRDSLNLILSGLDGYKEIHISYNNDYYIIKHIYKAHKETNKNHSVKSYISKNGNELNENGNVTSFKELVRIELGIEPDHLKLIRIGSNVTSMINLTETERKTFMSKLLDEIGIFLSYYKKINNDLIQVKAMISHLVDKMNKLGIQDKKEAKQRLAVLKARVEEEQEKFGKLSGLLSIYNHEIEKIEDTATLKDRLSSTLKKLDKMNKILENVNDLESTDASFYASKIIELEKQVIRNQAQIDSSNILIQNHLSTLNQLQEQHRSLEVQYQKEENNDKELQSLIEERRKLTEKIASIEILLGEYNYDFTKDEFDKFYVFIKNTQDKLDKTYEFGKKVVSKIISLLQDNRNVIQYINTHIMGLDSDEDSQMLFLKTVSRRMSTVNDSKIFENCNNDKCEAKQLWIQVKNLLENSEVERESKKDLSFYKDMEYAYQNIRDVLLSFADYKSIIERLPPSIQNDFKTVNIYNSIAACTRIFNETAMNDVLSTVTEYDNYISLTSKMVELEKSISRYEKTSNFKYISEQMESVSDQINEYQEQIIDLKKIISKLSDRIKDDTNTIETYNDLKETFEKHDELEALYEKLFNDYNSYIKNRDNARECERDIDKVKFSIDTLSSEIQKLQSNIDQYDSIKKELDLYNIKFDEMTLTKEALSSKKGMPLYYIKSYLGNTVEITNELLDIAFNGQIYLDDFKITPTEFSIPFYNRGELISDVKYASQGELSFLSIALSFGLASQTLSKYNIMLLDEIDGPLDIKNREKFIRILENQIDRIGSEQSFLITHNDMFSSYPVDIIDLGFNKNREDKYYLANYLDINRK